MPDYSVFFAMAERYWYRYDVTAENPEEAYKAAECLLQTSSCDPDDEIVDCMMGPFLVDVEDGFGNTIYSKELGNLTSE